MPGRSDTEAQQVTLGEKSGQTVESTVQKDESASPRLCSNPENLDTGEKDKETPGALQLIMTRNEQILAHVL